MTASVDPPEPTSRRALLAQLPRGPFVLFGLMTLATTGGPILMILALQGGIRADWPPDRPVEWAVVVGTTATVFGLMTACLALGLRTRKMLTRMNRDRLVTTKLDGEVES